MIAIAALVIGAVFGAMRARKRGGDRRDMLQYAAVHAMLFGLVGIFITIFVHRTLG